MVQALDRENHTTILKDMIEQAELKDKHKHLLQLEKSTIEERIDTAVPQENDGIFISSKICNKTSTSVQIWCEKKFNFFKTTH